MTSIIAQSVTQFKNDLTRWVRDCWTYCISTKYTIQQLWWSLKCSTLWPPIDNYIGGSKAIPKTYFLHHCTTFKTKSCLLPQSYVTCGGSMPSSYTFSMFTMFTMSLCHYHFFESAWLTTLPIESGKKSSKHYQPRIHIPFSHNFHRCYSILIASRCIRTCMKCLSLPANWFTSLFSLYIKCLKSLSHFRGQIVAFSYSIQIGQKEESTCLCLLFAICLLLHFTTAHGVFCTPYQ